MKNIIIIIIFSMLTILTLFRLISVYVDVMTVKSYPITANEARNITKNK